MPDTLTITKDWMELLRGIADEAERWRVLEAVYGFAADGTEPDGLSEIGKCVFMTIRKGIMERNRKLRYYHSKKTKRPSNSPSNSPSKLDAETVQIRRSDDLFPDTSNQHMNTDIPPYGDNKLSPTSPTGENSTARRVFKVPSLEEVKAYVMEKNLPIDPEEFYAYYSANGWMVGRQKMKSWQMGAQYWSRRRRNDRSPPKRDYSGI